tara:strand:- start:965 stop:1426 length:462 start_codon:yes stop_codon:yes gene_type:complete
MFKKIFTYISLSSIFLLNTHRISIAGNHKAICSFYSEYKPCEIILSDEHIEANLPTDYLYVDKKNFLDLNVYEDLSRSSNLIVGTVSSLILGPVGLVGFLVKKKTGTIDYGISFLNHKGRKKTAFIRFKNMNAASKMAEEISLLVRNISSNQD